MRPGSEKSAAMSSKVPPTTMPTRRKGSRISQIERIEDQSCEGQGPAKESEETEEQEVEHRVFFSLKDNAWWAEKVPVGG